MADALFIAMNRFQVAPGCEADFEAMWRGRTSRLPEAPGYVSFHLLRGPQADGHTLYASHTVWESEALFLDWTRSEAFRAAHAGAGGGKALTLGPPRFEGFAAVLDGDPPLAAAGQSEGLGEGSSRAG